MEILQFDYLCKDEILRKSWVAYITLNEKSLFMSLSPMSHVDFNKCPYHMSLNWPCPMSILINCDVAMPSPLPRWPRVVTAPETCSTLCLLRLGLLGVGLGGWMGQTCRLGRAPGVGASLTKSHLSFSNNNGVTTHRPRYTMLYAYMNMKEL